MAEEAAPEAVVGADISERGVGRFWAVLDAPFALVVVLILFFNLIHLPISLLFYFYFYSF